MDGLMVQYSTNEIRGGFKVEVDGEPYTVVSNEFVKPGKGQAFNRIKLKHLLTGRVIDRTFKSGEKLVSADVQEMKMRMLYKDADQATMMDDNTYEQISIPLAIVKDKAQWLMEDTVYDIVIYKGSPIDVIPPTFMEMKIVETAPGVRGDTASGRVLKPAVTESGAHVQVPLFVNVDDAIKIDTRTGEYVSRV